MHADFGWIVFIDSNLMWACEGPPPGVTSSLRNTVRISTQSSVSFVPLVNSKATFAPTSMNLKVKGLFIAVLIGLSCNYCSSTLTPFPLVYQRGLGLIGLSA